MMNAKTKIKFEKMGYVILSPAEVETMKKIYKEEENIFLGELSAFLPLDNENK
jgi:hypothetical protein